MKHLFALALAASALAACSSGAPERARLSRVDAMPVGSVVSGRVDALSGTVAVADDSAANAVLTLPPDAGAPGRLSERQYANGWRQSASLDARKVAGDWNDLAVDVQTEEPGEYRRANIPMGKPTQDGVRREILARFPGTPMRIVTRPMNNALGSFGLAIGAAPGGVRCAFAWQWVDDLRSLKGSRSPFGGKGMAASIRMRLCRKGVTVDQLAGWFEQLDISNAETIDRIATLAARGTGGRVIEHGGASAAGVGETVDASSSSSLESALVERGGVVSSGARAERRALSPRRHIARRHRAPRREAPEPVPVAAPAGGTQYLGSVGGAQAAYAPRGGAGFGPVRVNSGLPVEAFRGPAARGAATAASAGYGGPPHYLGR